MSNSSLDNKNLTVCDDDHDPWKELNWPYTISEILVGVTAIIGNSLVIFVFGKERRLRRRTKYYIISLAVADLLVGLLGIPFAILASIGLPRNFYLCLFTVSLLVVLCTISIFCLVAVSIDRYWAILYPMSYSRNVSSRTAIGIIIVCWLAGALVGFLPLLGWNEGGSLDGKCLFVKVMDYDYLVFLYFATIIIPAILLAAFYTHIYKVVLNQLRQMVMLTPRSSNQPGSPGRSSGVMLRMLGAAQKREVKATQNLAVIVLFFIICWIPLYTINCVKAFCEECDISQTLTNSCIILSHLNSSFNPLLYAYHLKDFRTAIRKYIFGSQPDVTRIAPSLQRGISFQIQRPVPDSLTIANFQRSKNPPDNSQDRGNKNHFDRIRSALEVPANIEENSGSLAVDTTFICFNNLEDDVFAKKDEDNPNLSHYVPCRSHSLQQLGSENSLKYTRYLSESQFPTNERIKHYPSPKNQGMILTN